LKQYRVPKALTFKIGVSRCVGVFWENGRTIRSIRTFKTPPEGSPFPEGMMDKLLEKESPISSVFISSVTFSWNASFAGYFRKRVGLDPIFFSHESYPLAVDYSPPESMGSDRLLSVLGVVGRFPRFIEKSFAVIDFGSHTTMTVFHNRQIVGGSIAPGIPLSLAAIGGGRILLGEPKRTLRPSRISFPGKSTEESIQAGTILGAVRSVEGLLSDAEKMLGNPLELFLTGGLSPVVRPMFHRSCFMDRHLLHRGAIRVLLGE
jgi:type III pantothenate kinase